MSKKILAALLAVMMVLSLVPMTALATEEPAAIDVLAAPLHDTRTTNAISDSDLNDGFSVQGKAGEDGSVDVTVTHTGLRAHGNGEEGSVMGYWVGVAIPQKKGNTYSCGFGSDPNGWKTTEKTSEMTENNKKYDTFYFNATALEGRNKAGIKVTNGDDTTVYNIDLSGVNRKVEFDENYTKFYWLKSEQPKEQCSIADWRDWTMLLYFKDKVPANQHLFATLTSSTGKVYGIALNSERQDQAFSLLTKSQFEMWPEGAEPGVELGDYAVTVYECPENVAGEAGSITALPEGAKEIGSTTIEVADDMKITSVGFGLDKATAMAATGLAENNCQDETMWANFSKPTKGQYWIEAETPNKTINIVAGTNGTDAESFRQLAWSYLNGSQTQGTGATAGDYKVRIYAYAGTTSGPEDKPDGMLLLDEKSVTVSDEITRVEVYKDDVLLTSIKAELENDAIKISGDAANAGAEGYAIKLVAYTANGKKAQDITLTNADKTLSVPADTKLTILKHDYAVSGSVNRIDTAIVPKEPVPDVTKIEEAQRTIVENAIKTIASDNLSDLATEKAAAVSYNDKDAIDKGLVVGEDQTVTFVVQPYLDVKAEAYDATTKVLTVNITAKYDVVATTAEDLSVGDAIKLEGEDKNAVKMEEGKLLEVGTPIQLEITLPAGFVTGENSIFVQHEKGQSHYHQAVITNDSSNKKASFTSDDGLSPFTFEASAEMAAKIGDKYYKTLQDAVAAISNAGTIVLLKDGEGTFTFPSGVSVVTIDNGEYTWTGTFSNSTSVKNEDGTITYTKVGGTVTPPIGGGSSGTSGNITVTKPANGTVTTTPSSAKEGDKVTVTVKTDAPYYIVTGVTAKGENGNVAVTKNADGTYSFTMPKGSVSVSATISHIYNLFKDVPTDIAEYGTAIKWAIEKGITLGTDTVAYSTFSPYNPCTRAQMVVFLYRAAGSPTVTGTNAFTDVPNDAEIQKAVQWAVSKGITKGTSDTTFDPYGPCTRGQMVTFLHRNHSEPAATGSNNFADVPADAFYKDAVQWAVNEGITNGTGDNTFAPNDACTRVQMVTFLYRDMGK